MSVAGTPMMAAITSVTMCPFATLFRLVNKLGSLLDACGTLANSSAKFSRCFAQEGHYVRREGACAFDAVDRRIVKTPEDDLGLAEQRARRAARREDCG